MERLIQYPSLEKVIEYNLLALTIIKAKKADSLKVLSSLKIDTVLDACKASEGDIYDKAVVLLKGLIKAHGFASGNRRTAFIVTKDFLLLNKAKFCIKDDLNSVGAMQGIRENFYSNDEIKEWIKHGKIKKFRR